MSLLEGKQTMTPDMRSAITTILLTATVQPALAVTPSFQVLDLPAGYGTSAVTDISGDGRVVIGDYCPWFQQPRQCFRWSDGVVTMLGSLPGVQGGTIARGVSCNGSVVVGASGGQAFRWENGVMSSLGVPEGFADSQAWDVSADGSTIVGDTPSIVGGLSSFRLAALRWENGVMSSLEIASFPPSDPTMLCARAISADGQTCVGIADDGVCFWRNGVRTNLGIPMSLPWGVSTDGSVIVGGGVTGIVFQEAWRWENGAATGLGHLPGGDIGGTASDTSANGSVVVGMAWLSDSDARAFIWTAAAGMRNLNDVLVNDYGLDLAGWTLTDVVGISDDGLTLTGNAVKGDMGNGWIVHIPEPGAVLLLMLGALGLPRRRSHRH